MATLHFASGDNLNANGDFVPGAAGFNLADVQSVAQLNALPEGVKGLVWLNQSDGVTQEFLDAVKPFIGNPKVFGFFLVDEPDPTGQWGKHVSAADLKAESDWIHQNVPGAKTFITMMNMGSSENPDFSNTYNPENTHIDLFGLDPYPVRSGSTTPDYDMIDRTVAAAEASGIPREQMVPVYQTFGGGNWVDDQGGHYVMPTAAQGQEMLNHWADLLPSPEFDYAYAWGSQNGDQSLEDSKALQDLFLRHNSGNEAPTGSLPIGEGTAPEAPAGQEATSPEGTGSLPVDHPSSVPPVSQDDPTSPVQPTAPTADWHGGWHGNWHGGRDFGGHLAWHGGGDSGSRDFGGGNFGHHQSLDFSQFMNGSRFSAEAWHFRRDDSPAGAEAHSRDHSNAPQSHHMGIDFASFRISEHADHYASSWHW